MLDLHLTHTVAASWSCGKCRSAQRHTANTESAALTQAFLAEAML